MAIEKSDAGTASPSERKYAQDGVFGKMGGFANKAMHRFKYVWRCIGIEKFDDRPKELRRAGRRPTRTGQEEYYTDPEKNWRVCR